MINLSSRVKHRAYGNGSVRKVERNAITVYFDCNIETTVDLSNLVKIGSIPESVQAGEYVIWNGKTYHVENVYVGAVQVRIDDTNGDSVQIPRYRSTVDRIRTV